MVKRATSLFNSFCSNVARQVARFLLPFVPCLKFQVIFQVSTSMIDLQFLSDIFFVFRHYYDALYSKALPWSLTISESLHATLCKAKAERILFVVVK